MPLTRIQSEILRLLASHRDPESYVAGSTPLNREAPRFSSDIDVFHDREEIVAAAAQQDSDVLREAGYDLKWLRREPAMFAVSVTNANSATRLEWAVDSDFRFYPTQADELFGYVLHPIDLATNKVSAAASRREPRDVVDLLRIHDTILPLGAVVWATAGKSLGFTPEGIIAEIRRLARYNEADFSRVASEPPVDPVVTMTRLSTVLGEADAFVRQMPTEKAGLLFLRDGNAVQPDPQRLDTYQTHAGQRRGAWPGSSEITSAMLDRYKTP